MDLHADEVRMAAVRRQAHAIAVTNEASRRRMRDADPSNWSTDSQPGSSVRIVDCQMNIDLDDELAHFYYFRYKADHFTWTHVCWGIAAIGAGPAKKRLQSAENAMTWQSKIPYLQQQLAESQQVVVQHPLSSVVLLLHVLQRILLATHSLWARVPRRLLLETVQERPCPLLS